MTESFDTLWFQNERSLNLNLATCNERNLAASCFIFLFTKKGVCWTFKENVGRRPVILSTRLKKVENEFLYYKEIVESRHIQGVTGGTDQTSGVFLSLNYTDITQNTYIQSSMVTEILAREV